MASTSAGSRVEQPSYDAMRQAVDKVCKKLVREAIAEKPPSISLQSSGVKVLSLRPGETREVFAEVVKLLGSIYRYKHKQNCLTQATILLVLYRSPSGFDSNAKFGAEVEQAKTLFSVTAPIG